MRRIKYLKSINKYLDEGTFKSSLAEKNYFTPIRNRYKGGPIDISKKICDLRTFSDEEIERMNIVKRMIFLMNGHLESV